MNLLLISDDFELTAAWRSVLARKAPRVSVCTPGEPGARSAVAALLDGPSRGRLECAPDVRWVFALNAGVEDLLDDEAETKRVLIRLICPEAIAQMIEYVCYFVMQTRSRFREIDEASHNHRWASIMDTSSPRDYRVGVLGLGQFGGPVAAALASLGYQVLGWSRTAKSIPKISCHFGEAGLDAVLADADVLVCLLPLTPSTRGLLSARSFRKMQRHASLINVSRGGCVDESDLIVALDEGVIAWAILDVFAQEPLPVGNPLWTHPHVTITPHAAADPSIDACANVLAAALASGLSEDDLPGLVDKRLGY